MRFRIFFLNIGEGQFSAHTAPTLEGAAQVAREAGFEASILDGDRVVAAWTIFGGLRVL